jgi:ribosome-binding protein aMBF1 (putative translation factor)
MTNSKTLGNAWNIVDDLADDDAKKMFELDDILYDISIKIFDYRKAKGWTQKQLAEKLSIKQSMVSKLESGEYNPTIEQLWKISKKLGWTFRINLEDNNETKTEIWDTVDSTIQLNSDDIDKLVKNS